MTLLDIQQEGPRGPFLSLQSGCGLPFLYVLVLVLLPGSWEGISVLSHLFPSGALGLCVLPFSGMKAGCRGEKLLNLGLWGGHRWSRKSEGVCFMSKWWQKKALCCSVLT